MRLGKLPLQNILLKRKDLERIKNSVFFKRPGEIINIKRQICDSLSEELHTAASNRMKESEQRLKLALVKLTSLDPLKVLERGYSVVKNQDGKVITDGKMLLENEKFQVIVSGDSFEGRKI